MDTLLLSLSHEQYLKYLKIKNAQNIKLDFDTNISNMKLKKFNIHLVTSKMIDATNKLLDLYNRDSFFAPTLKNENTNFIATSYFDVINRLEAARSELFEFAHHISNNVLILKNEMQIVNARYLEFIPYKVALFDNEDYKKQVLTIENEFNSSIAKLNEALNIEVEKYNTLTLICEKIVPSFYRGASLYIDAPKFKSIDERKLLELINSFLEQLKTYK